MTRYTKTMMLIYLTCEDKAEAKTIAKTLLEENLIACANIHSPVSSIYKWQGKIEEATEAVVILKTQAENYSKVQTRIEELHSYDCPAIIGIRVDQVNEDCLSWLENEL